MDAKTALELYQEAESYWSRIYKAFKEDVRFSIGLDHYSDTEINKYGKDGCMIVPVLPQFIHQVVNDMRMNTPSINVLPGEGEGADPETAKIFKGLIRNIEYKSNADEVYDTAGEYAVRGGLGFARVDHDYIDDESDLQELKLRRVQNPMSVMLDPSYVECDGSDAEYGFILEPIKKKAFEKRYPGKKFINFGDVLPDKDKDEINICEFFIKEYEEIESKGNRKLRKVKIGRYKFSGAEELEKTTFPGKYIPIVPFHGEEVWDNGVRNLLSLIRNAKDAQRRVNKWAVKESQILDMAPIAPILAPVGSVEDIPDGWTAPDDTIVLRYRMTDAAGNKLDKPERLQPPPIPTGIINAMQGAKESVKEALGMYNASIGQRSNETSGVAIDARKVEGEVATFHFGDNRDRSIQHIGKILVCAIPEIYDTDRIIQIVGEEETPQMVGINGAELQDGQEREYDLRRGKYDVRVTTGASYTTKRQEAAALLGDVLKTNPELMGVFGDLWAKNLDVAGAEAMAARLRKTIPKELTADEDAKENGEQAVDPEKIQMAQILEQAQMQIQQLTAALENKQGEELLKKGELEIKAEELRVKEAELQLKIVEAQRPQETGVDPMEAGKQQHDMSIDEREIALKEAEFLLKVEQEKLKALEMLKQAEQPPQQVESGEQITQEDPQEQARKDEQAAAVIQGIGMIAEQLNNLAAQVAQPKVVIRDPNTGMIQGVQ